MDTTTSSTALRRSRLGVVVAVALFITMLAPPAMATPAVHEEITAEFTEVIDDFCGSGLAVRHDYDETSRLIGVSQGADGLVHFRFRLHLREAWTNVATGQSLRLSTDGVVADSSVVDNGDGTLSKTTRFASSARWRDQHGKLVSLDSGLTILEVLIDHNGTPSDPSDDQTIDVRTIRESNGVNSDPVDFCDFVLGVIG